MEEVKVRVWEGDLVLEGDGLIIAEEGLAEVKGELACKGSCTVKGSLIAVRVRVGRSMHVEGDLNVHDDVKVEGALQIKGSLSAKRVKVDNSCYVKSLLKAEEVSIGGFLRCKEIDAGSVRVGGTFRVEKGKVYSVNVGGFMEFSELEAESISVGGYIDGGKARARRVSAGGSIEAEKLEVDHVSVGGWFHLAEGRLGRLAVGGTARVKGVLVVDELSVGGVAEIGELEGEDVKVGGALTLQRGGEVRGMVSVGGTLESKGLLRVNRLKVGGFVDVERLVAKEVEVGNLVTSAGVQAEVFKVSRKGTVDGLIVAREFLMEDGGSAREVYAKLFECGEGCRVQKLHAEKALIGKGSVIEYVSYVEELKLGEGARVVISEKVNEIKPPAGFPF
ncbi:MAG: polymer-forming cytoskeletal protein [Thermofilaceae archaeon]